ncbi:hypothetical protein EVAR_71180_1 [Eumeta japonica]|uniref:Uncharacterized protein n=1 Tax=Eumeta variegata TaxID=151549 RepID=A0A4C1SM13_EUMVA|nr:hypothetical protein EVAR_71180_1 [Eumeta japonica]
MVPLPSSTNMMASSSNNIPDVNFSGFSPTEFMSPSEDIAHNILSVEKYSRTQKRIAQAMLQTYSQTKLAQMEDEREADNEELIQRQQQLQQQQMQFEHDMLVDRQRQTKC